MWVGGFEGDGERGCETGRGTFLKGFLLFGFALRGGGVKGAVFVFGHGVR